LGEISTKPAHPCLGRPAAPGTEEFPAVADGKVVTFGVGEVLSCLGAERGMSFGARRRPRTSPPDGPRFYTVSSPIIVEGMCVAQLGGPGKGAVVAFDMANGEVK